MTASIVITLVEAINAIAFVISINLFLVNGQLPANYELRNISTFIISIGYFIPYLLISYGAILHKRNLKKEIAELKGRQGGK
jgi:hypothetical protein